MRRLPVFLTLASVAMSIVMFSIVTLVLYQGSMRIASRQAELASRSVSELVTQGLLRVMETGATRDEIVRAAASMRTEMNEEDGFDVEVFGRAIPGVPGGGAAGDQPDAVLDRVRSTGHEAIRKDGDALAFYFPVKATMACTSCHAAARPGDLLGVVIVKHDTGPSLQADRRDLLILLVFIFPLPILGAFLLARLFSRRVMRSVETIQACTRAVNEGGDLDAVDLRAVQLGFVEFDALLGEVSTLTDTLKTSAGDLARQVGVHQALMISAEAIRDWKAETSRMLGILNGVMPLRALVTAFAHPDGVRELVVFWAGEPASEARERPVRAMLEGLAWGADGSGCHVTHVAAAAGGRRLEPEPDEAGETMVRCIPSVSGVGGVVGAAFAFDAHAITDSPVYQSALATTLNVVGAMRAIDGYARQIEYHSTRDALTDLPNQKMFWELLDYEVGRAQRHDYRFCVLVLDFDGFKLVNDTYGHAVGDAFLREAAGVLHRCARVEDVVARYGGDEFAVIAAECDTEQGYLIARRLLDGLAGFTMQSPDGSPIRAAASIGLASFPDHGTSAKDLFRMADTMMYRSKADGKGRISTPSPTDAGELAASTGERGRIVQRAMAEGLFVPYFQPIVAIDDGAIVGHEVLLRVVLPERVVAAGDVIETIEAMGLINRVDLAVFEAAFARAREQANSGLLFLNFSPKALIDQEFMTQVRALVARYGIAPQRLVFEITERETVRNVGLLETFARDLVRDGFSLAIDDFGAGFSSTKYLRRFPVGTLKIDGQFVQGLRRPDGIDRAVMASVATLADKLGLRAVAEHVESADDLAGVAACGIRYAQGYHLGRPAPDFKA